jgi:hypothetical protein
MQIRLPRTALVTPDGRLRRAAASYVLLVRRVPRRAAVFPGQFFRAGATIDDSALWPSPAWPANPLLIEFAGSDGTGRGWRRSPDIHILWRYDRERGVFDEIARLRSFGMEWFHNLVPIVEREIRLRPPDHGEEAQRAVERLVAALDRESDELADEGRERALAMLYDEIAARLAESSYARVRAEASRFESTTVPSLDPANTTPAAIAMPSGPEIVLLASMLKSASPAGLLTCA